MSSPADQPRLPKSDVAPSSQVEAAVTKQMVDLGQSSKSNLSMSETHGARQAQPTSQVKVNERTETNDRPLGDVMVKPGVWRRSLAAVVDYGVVWMLALPFTGIGPWAGPVCAIFIVFFPYFMVQELCWSGRTMGKRLFNLQATRNDGKPLTFKAVAVRTFGRLVAIVCASMLLMAFEVDLPFFWLIPVAVLIVSVIYYSKSSHAMPWDVAAKTTVGRYPLARQRTIGVNITQVGKAIQSLRVPPPPPPETLPSWMKVTIGSFYVVGALFFIWNLPLIWAGGWTDKYLVLKALILVGGAVAAAVHQKNYIWPKSKKEGMHAIIVVTSIGTPLFIIWLFWERIWHVFL